MAGAGDAVVGALRVVLGTDTAQFEDGLKSATSSLGEFAKRAAEVAAGIGLHDIIQKTVESFGELVSKAIEGADQMGKFAQRVGIPTESLSAFSVAASIADVSVETLGRSMARLERGMATAASGGVGPAASAFMYLGISAKELKTLTPEETLNKIADAFQRMPDGANKTTLALLLFGRAGEQMIPALNKGSEGMAHMREVSEALGLVISTNTAKSAETFVESTKLIGQSVQGVANTVAAYFLPAMASGAESLLEWVVHSRAVEAVSNTLIRTIQFVIDNVYLFGAAALVAFGPQAVAAVVGLTAQVIRLAASLGAAVVANVLLANKWITLVGIVAAGAAYLAGGFDGLGEKLTSVAGIIGTTMSAAMEKIVELMGKAGINTRAITDDLFTLNSEMNAVISTSVAGFERLTQILSKPVNPNASEELRKFNNELSKIQLQSKDAAGQFNTLGTGFVHAAIAAGLFKDNVAAANFDITKMTPQMILLNNALKDLEKNKIHDELLTPLQKYNKELEHLKAIYGEVGQASDDFKRKDFKNWSDMIQVQAQALQQFAGGFAQLFQALGANNRGAFELYKAFATAEAIISSAAAVIKALAIYGPTPLGYAAAAGAAAAGLAQVIKIQSTKYTGAAQGGEFMVPGGSMGVDTRMVSMALAPGELVKVTSANDARSGGVQEIQMKGIRPGDLFTGDMVRGMFDALNRGYGDGYRVKFAAT